MQIAIYILSPAVAYNFSELLEAHAVDTVSVVRLRSVSELVIWGCLDSKLKRV